MLKRNEMIGVLQHLDEYEAFAFINAEGDPAGGLLEKLDCSEPQRFWALDEDGELIETPLEVVYDPYRNEDVLIWRYDKETPALQGVRLGTVATYSIRTLVAEVANYVFGMGRVDTEEDAVVSELVSSATGGGNDDEA